MAEVDEEPYPELEEADWDPSRDDDSPDSERDGGTRSSSTLDLEKWVVRLQYKQNGNDKEGNGFFVNMPHPTHHVILTAGHNLHGVNKHHLKICSESSKTFLTASEFYVSAAYVKTKEETSEKTKEKTREKTKGKTKGKTEEKTEELEDDYGVILVKKDPRRPYRGFGFALKRGHDQLFNSELDVYGLKDTDGRYQLTRSPGKCVDCLPNRIEYELRTDKGYSGSPVVMPYKDLDTAVAIHNYGHNIKKYFDPRGTRINEKMLDEISHWLHIGFFSKTIQAAITNKIDLSQRLYLVFIRDSGRAVVRLGWHPDLVTKFDILPAYAPPSNYDFPNDFRYAFRLSPVGGALADKRWVLWNADRHTVSLTSTLRGLCAVTLLEHKAPKRGKEMRPDQKFYYIHLEMTNHQGESTELRELRMRAADLTARDLQIDCFETPEVFFARHKRGKYLFGKIPCMPEAPSKPAPVREELDFNLFRFYSG